MSYLTLPNFFSLLRIPLALLFIKQNTIIRMLVISLAMISDGLDGFLARRRSQSSQFGAFLDPCMDRFFTFFAIAVLMHENLMQWPVALALFCRDIAVFVFGVYLMLKGKLTTYRFRAIWSGKVTTFLQFFVLLAHTFHVELPSYIFSLFIVLGVLALAELALISRQPSAYHQ